MDIGIRIYPISESISATWMLNKPFILSSRTNTLLVCIHHVGICFSTAIGNALQDILVAFRIINSSSPIKHPWSFLTPHRALVALQFLAFCFNSLPHHIW